MDHSYEELRAVVFDLLAGRETASYGLNQYQHLLIGTGEVFRRREPQPSTQPGSIFGRQEELSRHDRELFLELFWSLFREGIITLGVDDSNREFPFFRITDYGR